jgi:hypothetical protein
MRQHTFEETLREIVTMLDEGRERITDPSPIIQNRQRGELLKAVHRLATTTIEEAERDRRNFKG